MKMQQMAERGYFCGGSIPFGFRTVHQRTIAHPTAEQVQEVWSEAVSLWDDLTEEERTEFMGSLVRQVDVKEKDRIALQLSPVAELHDPKFVINSHMGAGAGLEPATFGL
jgi:hypothetical protein